MVKTIGRGGNMAPGAKAAHQERVARALELRAMCVECGATGLVDRGAGRHRKPGACSCGGRGHEYAEIGAALGVNCSTAHQYVTDPDGSKAAARREARKISCVDCGQSMHGGQGRQQAYRCKWCMAGEISPHLRATSPTGFRTFEPSPRCRCGCGGLKAPGRHVCRPMAERLAALRAELTREADDFSNAPALAAA